MSMDQESYELPPLTGNDIATALFGVGTRLQWLEEQRPRCQFWREEIARSKEVHQKLSNILASMDPTQIYEDETVYVAEGHEEIYAPTDEARCLQAEATRISREHEAIVAQVPDARPEMGP